MVNTSAAAAWFWEAEAAVLSHCVIIPISPLTLLLQASASSGEPRIWEFASQLNRFHPQR